MNTLEKPRVHPDDSVQARMQYAEDTVLPCRILWHDAWDKKMKWGRIVMRGIASKPFRLGDGSKPNTRAR